MSSEVHVAVQEKKFWLGHCTEGLEFGMITEGFHREGSSETEVIVACLLHDDETIVLHRTTESEYEKAMSD